MEHATFSLGSVRTETKYQKKQRLRKEKEWKRKEAFRKAKRAKSFVPIPKTPLWCILPKHRLQGFHFWIDTLKGNSFFEKKDDILQTIAEMKTPFKPVEGFDPKYSEAMRQSYLEKAKVVLRLLHENQSMRWKWKVFLTKARILRFQKVNEVDPITLESFKQPVTIHSFQHRKTYVFEAESLSKHIHKQLIKNDGHIPTPLYPKNPLTNQRFTLTETMALFQQTKDYGRSSWAIEAFKACRFDVTSFIAVHTKPLRLNALHVTMANTKDWDCRDTLYDFIKFQHRHHSKHFYGTDYKWAIENVATQERIEKWRKLCIKWYELDILMDDEDAKKEYFDVLQTKILVLCDVPTELQDLRISTTKRRREYVLIN